METNFNRNLRELHETAWVYDDYKEWSQGVCLFPRAWADLVPQYRDSLCDWGAGHGRAAMKFQEKGLRVEAIDIAENANRYFSGTTHICPIWKPTFESDKLFTLGYCTDVMNYVPADLVLTTLRIIKKHTVDECWFSIPYYTRPVTGVTDRSLIKTNKPASWWVAQFAEVFPRFRFEHEEGYFVFQAFCERL